MNELMSFVSGRRQTGLRRGLIQSSADEYRLYAVLEQVMYRSRKFDYTTSTTQLEGLRNYTQRNQTPAPWFHHHNVKYQLMIEWVS
jgi:hypothetical protein